MESNIFKKKKREKEREYKPKSFEQKEESGTQQSKRECVKNNSKSFHQQ